MAPHRSETDRSIDAPHFNLDGAVELSVGSRVLAINNMYGVAFGSEAMSVLAGIVATLAWSLRHV